MYNKGQGSFVIFVFVIIALILMAPIFLKIINTVIPTVSNNVASLSPTANQTGQALRQTAVNWFDYIILIGFFANVILLLVSAFLVDVHPAFVVFYMLTGLFMFIFAPNALQATQEVYGNSQFATETSQLPLTSFLIDNFGAIILGVFVISLILMFAKFKFGGGK